MSFIFYTIEKEGQMEANLNIKFKNSQKCCYIKFLKKKKRKLFVRFQSFSKMFLTKELKLPLEKILKTNFNSSFSQNVAFLFEIAIYYIIYFYEKSKKIQISTN